MVWVKTRTTAKEKDNMEPQERQITLPYDKVDELARCGALFDGAEFAEQVTEDALKVRKHMYAESKYATFLHCEVEDLFDMDETAEETKQKQKSQF